MESKSVVYIAWLKSIAQPSFNTYYVHCRSRLKIESR